MRRQFNCRLLTISIAIVLLVLGSTLHLCPSPSGIPRPLDTGIMNEAVGRKDDSVGQRKVSGKHDYEAHRPSCELSNLLETEPPQRSANISVRVDRWIRNANAVLSCPHHAAIMSSSSLTVPDVIHRIWECDEIPGRYEPSLKSWEENAPGMVILLWTEKLRKEFVSKHLGTEKLMLYERLVPGSYRADLFKYIIMYHVGGIYSDLDSYLLVNFSNLKFLREGTTLAIDLDPRRLLPGAILMAPREEAVFVCAMGEVFDHSYQRTYFGSDLSGSLDVSGPGVLGECVRHMLGRDTISFRPGNEGLANMKFRLLHAHLEDGIHTIELEGGVDIVSLQHGGQSYDRQVSSRCDPGEHYSALYSKNKVYRFENRSWPQRQQLGFRV